MNAPRLVATCWTSAGDVAPLDVPELSPFPASERVRAAAEAGWAGIGFGQDDLRRVRDTVGFAALRDEIREAGLSHVEVELGSGWWRAEDGWRGTWELLLDAAGQLGASFIKVGTEFSEPVADVAPFVAPLRRIADEAAAAGTRVALEPLPFGMIASMPQGAELIRKTGHPAAGLVVDFWHVFRAGTSLDELAEAVDREMVFGVELSDAEEAVVGTLFEDTRDNRTLIGRGAQDVIGFIRTMRGIGWDGPWGVEILSREHRSRTLVDALETARDTTLETFRLADA